MKTCFIIVLIAFLVCAHAQNTSGVIKYRFYYKQPLNIPQGATVVGAPVNTFELTAYLYFNTEKSLFDYDKTAYQSEEPVPYKRKRDEHGQMYYADKTLGELYIREFIYGKPYITHEPVPAIAWQLKNEVKTIAGYVCKKAEATFRGRKYTAWYTSSIPVSVGPWKLQGLPGAILEAKSEDGEVSFETESIRIPAYVESKLNIKQLPDGKIVTYKEYLETFETERKKTEESVMSMMQNFFEEEKKKGTIKEIPQAKGGIDKMFTIEKYE